MKLFYSLFTVFALLFATNGLAQPVVATGLTPEEYVNDILLGSGVQAFNITTVGLEEQFGHLTGAQDSGIPLAGGLLLATGSSTTFTTNIDDDVPFPFGGTSGEPDLLSISSSVAGLLGMNFPAPSSMNDVCIIEFDFVATGDTVQFNYVFASAEYASTPNDVGNNGDGYEYSQFNDIFGFFLSGPGITGPYDSPAGFPDGAVNIAFVPDTDPEIPVTISSINFEQYDEYYLSTTSNPDFGPQYDGMTQLLTAVSQVECGETYHIKLAIADGSDTALDSAVILEEGSFTSNSVVQVDLSIDVGGPDNDTMYEDCGEAVLTFTRPVETVLDIEEMVIIEYQGTGENGVDYTLLPDTVVFPPGVESVSFTVDAFEDGIPEGIELVQFEILNLAACNGGGLTSYFEFFIADEPEPLVVEGYATESCLGVETEIEPIITGGYGNFIYDWSTGEDTPSILVDPDVTTTYNILVGDTCGMAPDDADITVTVLDFPPLAVSIDQGDEYQIGCGEFVNFTATASGGDGFYTYTWTDEEGFPLGGWMNSVFYFQADGAEQIIVTIEDGCGFTATDTLDLVLNVPELTVALDPETIVLCNNQFVLEGDVVGGQAPLNYSWTVDGNLEGFGPQFFYTTDVDVEITLIVTDGCAQEEEATTQVVVESPAVEVTLPEDAVGPCTEVFDIDANTVGGSQGFVYTWFVNGELYEGPAGTASTNIQSDTDLVLSVEVVDQCGAGDTDEMIISIVNPPLEVELGEDINASCVGNTEIDLEILSGSGGYQYEWFVADTSHAITESIIVQSFTTVPVVVNVTDACGGSTTDNVLYIIPDIPLDITISNDTALCVGNSLSLSALATGGEDGFYYYWPTIGSYGADQYLTPYQTNTYEVVATDICGESITADVTVEVQYLFSNFTVSNLGENEYEFFGAPEPECEGCIFEWDFGDGTTSSEHNPSHTYDGLSNYDAMLTVTNALGCKDSVVTTIVGPVILYVPNAFTPNNDGINDVFRVYGNGMLDFELTVFNRWGETVFYSTDIEQAWNGNHQGGGHFVPDGVYSYVVRVKGIDTDAFEETGFINVMR